VPVTIHIKMMGAKRSKTAPASREERQQKAPRLAAGRVDEALLIRRCGGGSGATR
jgi:hypothetical protein